MIMKMGTIAISEDMTVTEARRTLTRLQFAYDECGMDWCELESVIFESMNTIEKLKDKFDNRSAYAFLCEDFDSFQMRVFFSI